MELKVKISDPAIYYNEVFGEWRLFVNVIVGNDVASNIIFSNKRKNKVKARFYKWCLEGILGDEMEYLFKQHKIHFKEK